MKLCPDCGQEMRPVTSRTPEGAWKCYPCEATWTPVEDAGPVDERAKHMSAGHRAQMAERIQSQLAIKANVYRDALRKIQNAYGSPNDEDDVTTTAREALALFGE